MYKMQMYFQRLSTGASFRFSSLPSTSPSLQLFASVVFHRNGTRSSRHLPCFLFRLRPYPLGPVPESQSFQVGSDPSIEIEHSLPPTKLAWALPTKAPYL